MMRYQLALPLLAASLIVPLRAADTVLVFDPPQTQIRWTLDAFVHTVHGTFQLRSGTVHFDPATGNASGEIIADFTQWIEKGAADPRTSAPASTAVERNGIDLASGRKFWSFQPPAPSEPRPVSDSGWIQSPVDRFILASLDQKGLKPVRPAGKRELIRRATFDLIGLPPTPEEIDAFLADEVPGAFDRVVERLLASPHYGERWGRYWLDVARYAEDQAHTFATEPNTSAFRYRDWVVKAFNSDLPYDRFIKLQIAGDQLEEGQKPPYDGRVALGFFGLGAQYYKNTDAAKAAADELDDRVDTLTRGFLGLTVSCARCHDHKFDPIPTQDYYSLAGIFGSSQLANVPLVEEEQVKRFQEAQERVQAAQAELKAFKAEQKKANVGTGAKGAEETANPARPGPLEAAKRIQELNLKIEICKKSLLKQFPVAHAMKDATPADMRVFVRGNPAQQGDLAPRRFLRVLAGDSPPPFRKGSGRLELAEAIASRDNPLTARVMVNRIWQNHFGRGIVGTSSNFGTLGERPSHPDLLDYLARRFVESGWSIKAIHREIMASSTYQLGTEFDPKNFQVDADNQLLWRANRRRLDVESWRDAFLAVSGRLDPRLTGASTDLSSPTNDRRTLYAMVSRHNLNSLLRLFDFPDPNITSDRRNQTTVPQQQLFVLNSPFVVDQARALANRLKSEPADPSRIRRAYLLAYGRPAEDDEVSLGLAFLAADDDPGEKPAGLTRWERYAQVLLSANEFLYLD